MYYLEYMENSVLDRHIDNEIITRFVSVFGKISNRS